MGALDPPVGDDLRRDRRCLGAGRRVAGGQAAAFRGRHDRPALRPQSARRCRVRVQRRRAGPRRDDAAPYLGQHDLRRVRWPRRGAAAAKFGRCGGDGRRRGVVASAFDPLGTPLGGPGGGFVGLGLVQLELALFRYGDPSLCSPRLGRFVACARIRHRRTGPLGLDRGPARHRLSGPLRRGLACRTPRNRALVRRTPLPMAHDRDLLLGRDALVDLCAALFRLHPSGAAARQAGICRGERLPDHDRRVLPWHLRALAAGLFPVHSGGHMGLVYPSVGARLGRGGRPPAPRSSERPSTLWGFLALRPPSRVGLRRARLGPQFHLAPLPAEPVSLRPDRVGRRRLDATRRLHARFQRRLATPLWHFFSSCSACPSACTSTGASAMLTVRTT